MSNLTNKQEAFAQAVITESTLSDAYRKAYDCGGMSDKTIHDEASDLAKHPEVSPRIAELRDRARQAADVTLERWMREQARIAYADPMDLYNDDGTLKPLPEMTPDARAAIASIDIEEKLNGSGDDGKLYTVKKIRLHSKTAAQDSLGRALGAYEKDNRQRGDVIPVIVNKPDWVSDDG